MMETMDGLSLSLVSIKPRDLPDKIYLEFITGKILDNIQEMITDGKKWITNRIRTAGSIRK